MAGKALETKGSLHERQQLPDAQVAALLAAAEQYREVGTKPMIAEALKALDDALSVRLAQAHPNGEPGLAFLPATLHARG